MTTAVQPGGGGAYGRPSPTGLADVIDTVLDKGLVIDAYVRVSLVGIELLTLDARVVVASVETYLQFADAANRLDLSQTEEKGIPALMENLGRQGSEAIQGSEAKAKSALDAESERLRDLAGGDKARHEQEAPAPRRRGRS